MILIFYVLYAVGSLFGWAEASGIQKRMSTVIKQTLASVVRFML